MTENAQQNPPQVDNIYYNHLGEFFVLGWPSGAACSYLAECGGATPIAQDAQRFGTPFAAHAFSLRHCASDLPEVFKVVAARSQKVSYFTALPLGVAS